MSFRSVVSQCRFAMSDRHDLQARSPPDCPLAAAPYTCIMSKILSIAPPRAPESAKQRPGQTQGARSAPVGVGLVRTRPIVRPDHPFIAETVLRPLPSVLRDARLITHRATVSLRF